MTHEARAARAVDQLSSLLRSDSLPSSVRRLGHEAQSRLSAPVGLAIMGWPDAQPIQMANAVLGAGQTSVMLPEIEGLPPATITFSEHNAWEVVMADGDTRKVTQGELALMDPFDLALIRRTAPLPMLEQVSLRVVVFEGDLKDVQAAVRWGTRGVEMLLWCSQAPQEDATLLAGLPEDLRDHTFLASHQRQPAASNRFVAAFDAPPKATESSRTALRNGLMDHISRGRREDLDCALMLLERYLPRQSFEVITPTAPPLVAEQMVEEGPSLTLSEIPPKGQIHPAAQFIDILTMRSQNIEEEWKSSDEIPVPKMLELCGETMSEIALTASKLDQSEDDADWAESLAEAADLMLLIQMEGSATALLDSLALLLQVRHSCEEQLAA